MKKTKNCSKFMFFSVNPTGGILFCVLALSAKPLLKSYRSVDISSLAERIGADGVVARAICRLFVVGQGDGMRFVVLML